MFSYTEEHRNCRPKNLKDAYNERLIHISTEGERVGRIEVHTNLAGDVIPISWYSKETPIQVEYYEPEKENDTFRRTNHIGYCRTVAEGKKIFADWYAEHKGEFKAVSSAACEVKSLPADPESEFYPTPSALAGQMAGLVDWATVETILEPSAGKGDLLDYAAKCAARRTYRLTDRFAERADCIEIDENLRHILNGKGYRVVHDDFLTFDSMKHYDLILMNPPFSNGDEHLLKALSMQKDRGGQIVCLLNAETIRNPYTNRRRLLLSQLTELGATIRFVSNSFFHAQRKSDVEVAVIYCKLTAARRTSFIFDNLQRAREEQRREVHAQSTELVAGDWIDSLIAGFQMEAKAGVALMDEYNALAPYIMNGSDSYSKPLIQLSVNDHAVSFAGTDTVNEYLQDLRYKYWSSMMHRGEITSRMTSQMQKDYSDKVTELQDYDFTRVNIERVIREIYSQLCIGVEDSILDLFETLSAKHSWYPECRNNVHYYSGWATNKAHKVNSKVILPINGFYATWDNKKKLEAREFVNTICDIERALSYLDGKKTICRIDPYGVARVAETRQSNTMTFSYFDATFYKKGTCHIKFHPSAQILVDRLNIFAARNRAWLPPCYGKKRYADMSREERAVVDEFQGQEAYEAVMQDPAHYIIAPAQNVPALTA